MKRNFGIAVAALGAAGVLVLGASMLEAKAPFVKKAQEAGLADVKDCTYCHVTKGKKDLNDAGKWLQEQKAAKKAADVDPAWLKDYKPAAKK